MILSASFLPTNACEPVRIANTECVIDLYWNYKQRFYFTPFMQRSLLIYYGNQERSDWLVSRFIDKKQPRVSRSFLCSQNGFKPFEQGEEKTSFSLVNTNVSDVVEHCYQSAHKILKQCKERKMVLPSKMFDIVHLHLTEESVQVLLNDANLWKKFIWILGEGYRARIIPVLWIEEFDNNDDWSRYVGLTLYLGENNKDKCLREHRDRELGFFVITKKVVGYAYDVHTDYIMQLHEPKIDNVNDFSKSRKNYYEQRKNIYQNFLEELDDGTQNNE